MLYVCVLSMYLCTLLKESMCELLDVHHTAKVEGEEPDNGPAPW